MIPFKLQLILTHLVHSAKLNIHKQIYKDMSKFAIQDLPALFTIVVNDNYV